MAGPFTCVAAVVYAATAGVRTAEGIGRPSAAILVESSIPKALEAISGISAGSPLRSRVGP